ncbi:MAG: NADH-quinone oxidoreductase subunit L [Candidatus Methylacidiphilales bacterium]|nr:NADH-quinone oxidoreductase subunit L [Candidatus Methylacidiphilales bacterium]
MNSLLIVLLMPLAPLLAALVAGMLRRENGRMASSIVTCAAGASLVASLAALMLAWAAPGEQPAFISIPWIQAGTLRLELGFLLDVLSASMAVVVALVSFLVMIYARTYMAEDPRHGVFFAFLGLFEGAMLGLVLSNSLLQLFMFWELVGLASYLLVGFWHEKPAAAAAARKAFLTTRIGDVALLFGMLLLFAITGTVTFHQYGGSGLVDEQMLAFLKTSPGVVPGDWGVSVVGAAMLLIFAGAAGKSGQVPLHVWLPDAMEGPTPVSALIHAATMVAAGIYLMARLAPMLALDEMARAIAAGAGAVTMLLGSLLALGQTDLKRVLAFSTISQLGLMMVAVAWGTTASGMMHLTTHAFFKALLFLSAGVLIHQLGTQEIRQMGGRSGKAGEPEAALTLFGKAGFLIGLLCLADVPVTFILAQVTSKEMVLHDVSAHGGTFSSMLTGALLLGSTLTALYATRLAFRLNLFSIFALPWLRAAGKGKEAASSEESGSTAQKERQKGTVGRSSNVKVSGRGRFARDGHQHGAGSESHSDGHGHAHATTHGSHGHGHDRFRVERDLPLVAPLAVLALLALFLVLVLSMTRGLTLWEAGLGRVSGQVASAGAHGEAAHPKTQQVHGMDSLTGIALLSIGMGIAMGVWLYRRDPESPAAVAASARVHTSAGFRRIFAPVVPAFRNRFYLDELYAATLGRAWAAASGVVILLLGLALLASEAAVFAGQSLARLLSSFGDALLLDRWLFDGSCSSLKRSGSVTTSPENGYLPGHLRWFVVGVVALALVIWMSRF